MLRHLRIPGGGALLKERIDMKYTNSVVYLWQAKRI